MRSSILFTALASGLLTFSAGCSHRAGAEHTANVDAVAADSLLPQVVKSIVTSINASDSAAFANLISYPLQRPYPLHDIPDSETMREYYSVLADDSLRNIVTTAAPDRWQRYGWRGWSLYDGQYIWADDSIYSVPYLSATEQKALDLFRANEIESLEPSLRGNWIPVACLKAADSPAIYRIDVSRDKSDRPIYRLAGFKTADRMRGKPSLLMSGYIEVEGSAAMTSYTFSSPDGTTAFYQADSPDGSPAAIIFSSPLTGVTDVAVTPAYWLDILPERP